MKYMMMSGGGYEQGTGIPEGRGAVDISGDRYTRGRGETTGRVNQRASGGYTKGQGMGIPDNGGGYTKGQGVVY